MRAASRLFLLIAVVPLASCGSNGPIRVSSGPTAPTSAADGAGNWYFAFPSVSQVAPIDGFLDAITVQGSTISGTFRINDPQHTQPCIPAAQDVTFSGVIDSSNVLTLTSESFSGSVATLTVPLSAMTKNFGSGIGQITGSSCAFAARQMDAQYVPSISGTYTGTVALNPHQAPAGAFGSATLVLAQAPPNADGQFPITGSLTLASSDCNISTGLTGTLTGPFLRLQGALAVLSGSGVVSSTATAFTASSLTFHVSQPTAGCASGWYGGPLTRQ